VRPGTGRPLKAAPHPWGLGNEWSGTSKAGQLLMLSRVEREGKVVVCKMGHVGTEPPSRGP